MSPSRLIWPLGLFGLMIWLMVWGSLPAWQTLLILAAGLIGLARLYRYPAVSLDWIARRYEVVQFSTAAKLAVFVGQLIAVLAFNRVFISSLSLLLSLVWILAFARIRPACYGPVVRRPLIFLALSGLVFLFQLSSRPAGFIQLPLLDYYLNVTSESRLMTGQILLKVLAAYHALLSLIMTTPQARLMAQLERLRVPSGVIELMYLIARNINILGTILDRSQASAGLRLGFAGYWQTGRTMKGIASRLLAQGLQVSRSHYAALACRHYQGRINLLHRSDTSARDGWLYLAGGLFVMIGLSYALVA